MKYPIITYIAYILALTPTLVPYSYINILCLQGEFRLTQTYSGGQVGKGTSASQIATSCVRINF